MPARTAASKCGACLGTCNEELGRCDCIRGFAGPDCGQAPEDLPSLCKSLGFKSSSNCSFEPARAFCINACNGRGRCVAGVCVCQAGFYGTDCSLSLDAQGKPELLAGLGYKPRAKRPHVYVYEISPEFNTWPNRADRPLAQMLHQRLLSSGARVADGADADYYFVPLNMRGPSDSALLQRAIRYIRATWPWWDQLQGARHLLVHVGDPGRGDVLPSVRDLTRNCVYLHHWGLHQDYPPSGWKAAHRPGHDIVVPLFIGAHQGLGHTFRSSPLHPRSPSRQHGSSSSGSSDGSKAALLDAPLGPSDGISGEEAADSCQDTALASKQAATSSSSAPVSAGCKTLELFFAGRICGGGETPDAALGWPGSCFRGINPGYSQGVRQMVHYHHWNRSGYKVVTVSKEYQADLARARFCLAPTGGGHGHRQIVVAFAGCVPLLIGDYVYQPFEPELDWSRFSMALPQDGIPALHEALAAVTDRHYETLQEGLLCAAEHLTYSSIIGGFKWDSGKWDAFETTLEILRARLQHPHTPPEKLAQVDRWLKAFMECRDDLPDSAGSASHAPTAPQQQRTQAAGQPSSGAQQPSRAKRKSGQGAAGSQAEFPVPEPGPGAGPGSHEPPTQPRRLTCSLSLFDGNPPPCERCFRGEGIVGAHVPGGTACCGAPNLAACRRAWD